MKALNFDHEGLLPGLLNTVKGLFYTNDPSSRQSRGIAGLRLCEQELCCKWGTLCSRSHWRGIMQAVAAKELQVCRPELPL